jgi:hypothetical protein
MRKRMKRDGIAGMLQAIVVTQNRVLGEGSYEAICTEVFAGDRLMTFYQASKNGTIRRVKPKNGRFERTHLYAGPYRAADPLDFDRAGVGWYEMEACA